MAEAGDAGVALAVIALAAVSGPPDKLDVVSGGIHLLEVSEGGKRRYGGW